MKNLVLIYEAQAPAKAPRVITLVSSFASLERNPDISLLSSDISLRSKRISCKSIFDTSSMIYDTFLAVKYADP